MTSQHRMPSTVPSACGKRFLRNAGSASSLPSFAWRSRSAKMSSTKILQPSCSPKKLTLLPTTGPRSSRTGDSRLVSDVRNLRSALVAKDGIARPRRRRRQHPAPRQDAAARDDRGGPILTLQVEETEERAKPRARIRASVSQVHQLPNHTLARRPPGPAARAAAAGVGACALRRRLGGCAGCCALSPLRCMSTLPRKCAPFGNRHARRDDVAVDRAVVADVDLLAGRHVAGHLAEHDHGLREHLRLDLAVRPDRQHVVAELDRALRRGPRWSDPRCRSTRP